MLHIDKLNEWEKMAMLSLLLERATPEARQDLMQILPLVYNKLVGCEVMTVAQKRADPTAPSTTKPTIVAIGGNSGG